MTNTLGSKSQFIPLSAFDYVRQRANNPGEAWLGGSVG